jgi:hypothetical protein
MGSPTGDRLFHSGIVIKFSDNLSYVLQKNKNGSNTFGKVLMMIVFQEYIKLFFVQKMERQFIMENLVVI